MHTFPRTLLSLIAFLFIFSVPCSSEDSGNASSIETLLRGDERFKPFLTSPQQWRLQIVVGHIKPDADGRLRLVQSSYRADAEYFYPASSIKLCAAVAALEHLEALRRETGIDLSAHTPLVYHPQFADEQLEDTDPTHLANGKITLAQEIRKLFLVSDNTAFNRLYELIGPDGLNKSMHRAGLRSARIVHRLSERRTAEENLQVPRIDFVQKELLHTSSQRTAALELPALELPGLHLGQGYLRGGKLIEGPMDFSGKNRMSLIDLQRALAMVVRPEVDVGGAGFQLPDAHRQLLLEPMSQLPRESKDPKYDPSEYPDDYVKFLLPGLTRVLPAERLRIYNKIGQAYGFSVENSYVVDTETGRSFFLAAVIYTNKDGVLNDDQYEYEEVAGPFFANLGEVLGRAFLVP